LNRGPKKNGTSKYKGVNWDKSRKKYLARVKVGGKYKNLGRFVDEKEAARAYNRGAIKYYGKDCLLNDV